ncbi:MAG: YbjN domain-containing protein [Actinobacteria bacterium]|nr:YbjN domain-containing protein [Actinomycetota bacterium]MBI3687771.1 YbjN domain-containing protein [Actinomycetota bacterium]
MFSRKARRRRSAGLPSSPSAVLRRYAPVRLRGHPIGGSAHPRVSLRGPAKVRPTPVVLAGVLAELGVRYTVDADGDLCSMWDGCRVYLMLTGPDSTVLRVLVVVERRAGIEDKPWLLDLVDDWNRSRLSGKAYTTVGDDGQVGLCAEHVFDFSLPVERQLLVSMVRRWIVSLLRFSTWVGERV